MVTVDELRPLFLFEAFSEDQFRWLVSQATDVSLPAGERILTENEPSEALWVLLDGELHLSRKVSGREVALETTSRPSTWAGWLPVFDTASPINVELTRPSRLLRIPKEAVSHMLATGFPIATHLLAGLSGGVRNFEAVAQQQERLAALGKLSAGLAHELNNPAAAARRAAARLRDALRERDERAIALGRRIDPTAVAVLVAIVRDAGDAVAPAALDPLARADREDALIAWLEERGVDDAYEFAPALADAGLDAAHLERIGASLPGDALPDAVAWLGAALAADDLARDVERSAARISELVAAIKDYSYMDRAPVQDVDVRDGLENTLKIMAYKLRDVTVVRDYDPNLPRITAHGSELNQVWTNLLDNAVDAVSGLPAGERRITIRTAPAGAGVTVEIGDNGTGIAPEILDRIFDPFFTTKGVGEGTGLGLDTSYRIVVKQHGGDLRVRSRPGDTRFEVVLPGQ